MHKGFDLNMSDETAHYLHEMKNSREETVIWFVRFEQFKGWIISQDDFLELNDSKVDIFCNLIQS